MSKSHSAVDGNANPYAAHAARSASSNDGGSEGVDKFGAE